jgi:hypothetical protein
MIARFSPPAHLHSRDRASDASHSSVSCRGWLPQTSARAGRALADHGQSFLRVIEGPKSSAFAFLPIALKALSEELGQDVLLGPPRLEYHPPKLLIEADRHAEARKPHGLIRWW